MIDLMKVLDREAEDRARRERPDWLQNHWVPFKKEHGTPEMMGFIFRPLRLNGVFHLPQSYVKVGGSKIHVPSEGATLTDEGHYLTRCGEYLSAEDYEEAEEYMYQKSLDRWSHKPIIQAHSMYVQIIHTVNMGPYWKIPENHVVAITYFQGFKDLLHPFLQRELNPEDLDPENEPKNVFQARLDEYSWALSPVDPQSTAYTTPKLPKNEYDLTTIISKEHDPEMWEHAIHTIEDV